MSQRPLAIGLTLCEQVVIEEKTQNVTLVNCFSERAAKHFPSDPIPFVAFALLTDGQGDVTIELAVEHIDTLDVVYRKLIKAGFPGSLSTMRFQFRVLNCSFPVAGGYRVILLADGELLAQRKMKIMAKGGDGK